MCCSDLGREWAACNVVLERFARPHGNVENDKDEQQGAHKLKEEAACSDAPCWLGFGLRLVRQRVAWMWCSRTQKRDVITRLRA